MVLSNDGMRTIFSNMIDRIINGFSGIISGEKIWLNILPKKKKRKYSNMADI